MTNAKSEEKTYSPNLHWKAVSGKNKQTWIIIAHASSTNTTRVFLELALSRDYDTSSQYAFARLRIGNIITQATARIDSDNMNLSQTDLAVACLGKLPMLPRELSDMLPAMRGNSLFEWFYSAADKLSSVSGENFTAAGL